MRFCFKCSACGNPDTVEARIGQAPERIRCSVCGEWSERDFTSEGDKVNAEQVATQVKGYPYVSHRLPRNLDGCECDRSGKPVIRNPRHEREVMARHGYKRE